MRIFSILKKVFQIGAATVPVILNSVTPGMGTLVGTVLNAILHAEAQLGAGTGEKKREAAMAAIQVSAPAIVQLIELQTGKQLADEEKFAEGMGHLQDALVEILNSFTILPKGTSK